MAPGNALPGPAIIAWGLLSAWLQTPPPPKLHSTDPSGLTQNTSRRSGNRAVAAIIPGKAWPAGAIVNGVLNGANCWLLLLTYSSHQLVPTDPSGAIQKT